MRDLPTIVRLGVRTAGSSCHPASSSQVSSLGRGPSRRQRATPYAAPPATATADQPLRLPASDSVPALLASAARASRHLCDLWVMSDVDRVSPVPPRPPSTDPDQRKPAQRCRPVSPVPTPRDATRFTDPFIPPSVIVKTPPGLRSHMHPLLRETRLLSFVGPRGADRESRRGCTSTEGPAEWITLRPEATGGWSAVCDHCAVALFTSLDGLGSAAAIGCLRSLPNSRDGAGLGGV
jgi:hypothetical protein